MRKILDIKLVAVSIWVITMYTIVGLAQEVTPTPIVLPEGYIVETTPSFPASSLFCEDAIRTSETGQVWNNVTIGVSNVDELLSSIEEIGDYSVRHEDNMVIAQVDDDEVFRMKPSIKACIDDEIVTVLQLSYIRPLDNAVTWDFFIMDYGEPDAVTWYEGINAVRVLFWFEEGTAIVVSTLNESIGVVSSIIYFPAIVSEDYENAYPYNRTWSPNTQELEDVYGEQNPFDFEDIIATVTMQPSGTPTATLPPRTVEATATP